MVDNKKEPTFEFKNWFDGGNIFYRSVDKHRFQHALDAVADEDLGLAVIGTNETVLDHYCRMLVARFRELNIFQVEVFLPANTDSLLKRFNEMLASMSMENARQPADPAMPVKLLVVNDAKAVDDEQWTLLVRLLADFPGVNVRLVLFVDKTGWPGHERLLGLFGRRLYRWVVETPTLDEARELMIAAKEHGFERETETMLLHAGLGAAVQGGYADESQDEYSPAAMSGTNENGAVADDSGDTNPFNDSGVSFVDDADTRYDDEDIQPQKSRLWPVLAIFLGSLALTWVVVSMFNPDGIERYEASVSSALTALADTSKSSQISEPITLPVDQNEVTGIEVVKKPSKTQATSQIVEAQAIVAALNKDKLAKQNVAEKKVDQRLSAEALANQRAALAKAAKERRQQVADRKKARVSGSVQGARATDFFVQHIVLSTTEQAQLYVKRFAGLSRAKVVPIAAADNIAYAVLSGPFSTKVAATEFTKGSGLPADYWIRGAQQLKTVVRN